LHLEANTVFPVVALPLNTAPEDELLLELDELLDEELLELDELLLEEDLPLDELPFELLEDLPLEELLDDELLDEELLGNSRPLDELLELDEELLLEPTGNSGLTGRLPDEELLLFMLTALLDELLDDELDDTPLDDELLSTTAMRPEEDEDPDEDELALPVGIGDSAVAGASTPLLLQPLTATSKQQQDKRSLVKRAI
jgi:hypothetical protein